MCVKLLYVKFVCVKLLSVKFVYVKLLYVKFVCVKLLYVKFVCVCVKLLYVKFVLEEGGRRRRRRRRRRSPGYRIKNKNPTQRCGEKKVVSRYSWKMRSAKSVRDCCGNSISRLRQNAQKLMVSDQPRICAPTISSPKWPSSGY